jgi:hypothetical protein
MVVFYESLSFFPKNNNFIFFPEYGIIFWDEAGNLIWGKERIRRSPEIHGEKFVNVRKANAAADSRSARKDRGCP